MKNDILISVDEKPETNDLLFGEHDPYVYQLKKCYHDLDEINNLMYDSPTKSQLKDSERTKPVQPKSQLNRNDLCLCGSGKKYKNCCLNKNI